MLESRNQPQARRKLVAASLTAMHAQKLHAGRAVQDLPACLGTVGRPRPSCSKPYPDEAPWQAGGRILQRSAGGGCCIRASRQVESERGAVRPHKTSSSGV